MTLLTGFVFKNYGHYLFLFFKVHPNLIHNSSPSKENTSNDNLRIIENDIQELLNIVTDKLHLSDQLHAEKNLQLKSVSDKKMVESDVSLQKRVEPGPTLEKPKVLDFFKSYLFWCKHEKYNTHRTMHLHSRMIYHFQKKKDCIPLTQKTIPQFPENHTLKRSHSVNFNNLPYNTIENKLTQGILPQSPFAKPSKHISPQMYTF
ncbi:hypothetical protein RFI_27024 [Reticulomyxa filosa]|uniref:Uncharacterized protein n=1 Tax=Reticulomyxa filosa TaxID=46433 RepID=X6M8X9_RETFI|nr:hypothetical protein RFI_27024 [Reticulomyxa filosa]|eukprot:ETO10354.1 hypothetical protein RFI_27024 [Reticulomyxa filosa]